jgi:hypothetical protein
VLAWLLAPIAEGVAQSPFASEVVSYTAGEGVPIGFDSPASALGEPTRMSGGIIFPTIAVTPFQPAYMSTELVSIGFGGELIISFDHAVEDDPLNPFGIDLLIFGNAFCTDAAFPAGVSAGLFGEGGTIEVSVDGISWSLIEGISADGPFPTIGWLDAGPYDEFPGNTPATFTRPVNPLLDLTGLSYNNLLAAYDGAGGGAGIDLASVGLAAIRYVRVSNLSATSTPEIDAFADVAPEGTPYDISGDGLVNGVDLGLLLAAWAGDDPEADLNNDGIVDGADIGLLLVGWTL